MFDSLLLYRKENASTLKSQVEQHMISHSMLFSGPPYSGKMSLAIELARVISCLKDGDELCNCSSCKSFYYMSMPNVIILSSRDHEVRIKAAISLYEQMNTKSSKRNLIGQIRIALMAYHEAFVEKQDTKNSAIFALANDIDTLLIDFEQSDFKEENTLINQLKKLLSSLLQNKRPTVSIDNVRGSAKWTTNTGFIQQKRFILLENIEQSTIGANNSLLKLLEEPPADTYIILLSEHPKRLLPTILSRVQHHQLKPITLFEKEAIFRDVFFADPSHYASIEEFIYAKAGIPIKELEQGAKEFVASIATHKQLESSLFYDILILLESQLALSYFLEKIEDALKEQLMNNTMSVKNVKRIQQHLNESTLKARVFNQQIPVLFETLYYRLVEMI